jgi:FkbM family methyltransferase
VTPFRPESSDWARLVQMLSVHGVDTVLDVGANTGQYAKNLRDAGFRDRVISFEPLSEAHSQLRNAARHDPLWTVAERMAISDENGQAEIHVSANSVSSSLLPMLASHCDAEPGSAFVYSEPVTTAILDSVAWPFIVDAKAFFIKIDVQGSEDKVLGGARLLLERAMGLQIELSLTPLYQGETLFEPMLQRLGQLDFELWTLAPGFVDKRTGRLLQVDGVFFKRASLNEAPGNATNG